MHTVQLYEGRHLRQALLQLGRPLRLSMDRCIGRPLRFLRRRLCFLCAPLGSGCARLRCLYAGC